MDRRIMIVVLLLLFTNNSTSKSYTSEEYIHIAREQLEISNYQTVLYALNRSLQLKNSTPDIELAELFIITYRWLDNTKESMKWKEIYDSLGSSTDSIQKSTDPRLVCVPYLSESEWKIVDGWIRLELPLVCPSAADSIAERDLRCLLNLTIPLKNSYNSYRRHSNILKASGYWSISQRILIDSTELFKEQSVQIFANQVNNDMETFGDLNNAQLTQLKRYSNDWAYRLLSSYYDRKGRLKPMRSILTPLWSQQYFNWLQSKPTYSNCQRKIVFDPFIDPSDPSMTRYDLITEQPFRTFGWLKPKTIRYDSYFDRINLTFTDREVSVFTFSNATIDNPLPVITDCAVYSFGVGDAMPIRSERPIKRVGRIVIASAAQSTFYHGSVELLSRLLAVEERLFKENPSEWEDVSIMIQQTPWIIRMLEISGLNANRKVHWFQGNFRYKSSLVIIGSWPAKNEEHDCTLQRFAPPAWLLLKLRDRILGSPILKQYPSLSKANSTNRLVVYTIRTGNVLRRVKQEPWLLYKLRTLLESRGYQLKLHSGHEAIDYQIRLYQSAAIVISPHGSGMANLLFCKPGTSVIEFPLSKFKTEAMAHLAMAFELDYWVVPSMTSNMLNLFRLDSLLLDDILETVSAVVDSRS